MPSWPDSSCTTYERNPAHVLRHLLADLGGTGGGLAELLRSGPEVAAANDVQVHDGLLVVGAAPCDAFDGAQGTCADRRAQRRNHRTSAVRLPGFRGCPAVCSVDSSPWTAEPMIGRRTQRAWLEDAVAEAVAGRGALVLLAGDAGIGKTRLAEDVCGRAPGATFLRGAALPSRPAVRAGRRRAAPLPAAHAGGPRDVRSAAPAPRPAPARARRCRRGDRSGDAPRGDSLRPRDDRRAAPRRRPARRPPVVGRRDARAARLAGRRRCATCRCWWSPRTARTRCRACTRCGACAPTCAATGCCAS